MNQLENFKSNITEVKRQISLTTSMKRKRDLYKCLKKLERELKIYNEFKNKGAEL